MRAVMRSLSSQVLAVFTLLILSAAAHSPAPSSSSNETNITTMQSVILWCSIVLALFILANPMFLSNLYFHFRPPKNAVE
jgi:hypothetical protein